MLDVSQYIKLILQKKKWTLKQFADEINKVKEKAGINSKTTRQNINNFLNQVDDKHILRSKQLVLWEKALELPLGTLYEMVELPKTRDGMRELKEIIKKVRGN
ncbi:MAG: hypothetical protein KH135_00685 [Firmicutes bacterium]|nr:hypothetical protein [Bacillota bacterium]